jgi:hypothetical protein
MACALPWFVEIDRTSPPCMTLRRTQFDVF